MGIKIESAANDEWPMVRLGDICDKPKKWTREPNDRTQYIDIGSIDSRRKRLTQTTEITSENAPSRAQQIIKSEDVIVSTVRPNLNNVALITPEFDNTICSTGFSVLRPTSKIVPEYLFHYTQTEQFISQCISQSTGISYPATSDKKIRGIKIPLPPIEEQRKIAKLLQRINSIVENCDLQNAYLESVLLEAIRKSMQGIDSTTALSSISIIKGGITPPKNAADYWGGDVNWFTTKDLKNEELEESQKKVTELAISETSLTKTTQDSIAISVRGMSLAHRVPISIIPSGSAVNQDLKSIIPSIKEYPVHILFHLIKMQEKHLLSKVSSSAHGTKKLDFNHISNIQIPQLEQSNVVNIEQIISKVNDLKSLNKRRLDSAMQLQQSLTARLLA